MILKKDTNKLLEELGLCPDFHDFYADNQDSMIQATLSDLLNQYIHSKHLRKADIVKCSEISEVYCYQILSGKPIPERKKLLCIAIGMQLNLEETQTLLRSTGYSLLYARKPFDCIVIYGIYNQLSVMQINQLLYKYELPTLG